MRLNSKTLENLELFQNIVSCSLSLCLLVHHSPRLPIEFYLQEDKKEKSTLFWVLNHTRTPFGRRLLRRWIAYPLRKVSDVQERQTAVHELSSSESLCVPLLKKVVTKLPDLEKMLCSTYHKKVMRALYTSVPLELL